MKPMLVGKLMATVSILVAIVACVLIVQLQPRTPFSIEEAWIRPPLPSSNNSAAYCTFVNRTSRDLILASARSNTIGRIEFHESVYENELHRMVHFEVLTVPARNTLALSPGGLHLMLFRLRDATDGIHHIEFTTSTGESFGAEFVIEDRGK